MTKIDPFSKDLLTGVLLMAVALFFAVLAQDYDIGEARKMGPGFFPLVLTGLLFLLGAILTVQAARNGGGGRPDHWTLRGLVLIVLPPLLFGLLIRELGLVITLFSAVGLCAFASRKARGRSVLLLAGGLTLFCVAVFVFGLGLPLPLFGRWLQFGG